MGPFQHCPVWWRAESYLPYIGLVLAMATGPNSRRWRQHTGQKSEWQRIGLWPLSSQSALAHPQPAAAQDHNRTLSLVTPELRRSIIHQQFQAHAGAAIREVGLVLKRPMLLLWQRLASSVARVRQSSALTRIALPVPRYGPEVRFWETSVFSN